MKTASCTSSRRTLARLLASALLVCTLLPALPSARAFAENASPTAQHGETASAPAEQRVVRVGYMPQEGVLERNEDGTFQGYTYDYLIHIAQFTGWTYEFIEAPGDTDNEQAANLVDMLMNGEVDIEGSMVYSQSLAELFEYPKNSYGTAHTALFVSNSESAINQTDLFTRDQVSVALLSAADKRREELVYFFEQNGIDLAMIDCESPEELFSNVLDGKADAFLDVDVNIHEGFHSVVTFAGRPYFFAAPKGQRDVIDEIDETINLMNRSNPTLQDELYDQYFTEATSDYALTSEELTFARNHETLRVGVVSEKAPVQSFNKVTGAFEGASKGVLDYLSEHAGFTYEIVPIGRSDDTMAAIREADVDLVAGVDRTYAVAEGLDLSLSAPYMSASKLLVYNKFTDPDNLGDKKRAVPWEQATFASDDANIVVCDSAEACLEAVNDGRADYTYSTSYSVPYYLGIDGLNNLLTLPASSQAIETCFGLVQPAEPELLQIINKSIRSLSSTELDSIVYDNSLIDQEEQVNLFFSDHLLEIALGFISLLIVVILLLALYLRARIRAARSVREENQRFQKLYSLANEQFFEYSIKNDTLLVSKPSTNRAFMPPDEDEGRSDAERPYRIFRNARERLQSTLGPELADAFTAPRETVIDAPFESDEGPHRWLRIMSHFVTDDTGKPVTVIGKIANIDDEVREKLDLSRRAHHDGLTGLLNWKTFQERVEELLEKGEAGALLIIDTDDFKNVNDSYGHLVGDGALQSTAAAIAKAFRPDDLVGRLGGDEFAVCVRGGIAHDKLSERCNGIIAHAVTFPDQDGQMRAVTLSIGGVELPAGTAVSYEAAYRQADSALYRAKADGKDRFLLERYRHE